MLVEQAVNVWRRIANLTGRLGIPERSDDLEFIGADARDLLQTAITALPDPARRQLAHLVDDLDNAIQPRTVQDPGLPPGPWWRRTLVTD